MISTFFLTFKIPGYVLSLPPGTSHLTMPHFPETFPLPSGGLSGTPGASPLPIGNPSGIPDSLSLPGGKPPGTPGTLPIYRSNLSGKTMN